MIATHQKLKAWIATQQSSEVKNCASNVLCGLIACVNNPKPHPAYEGFFTGLVRDCDALARAVGQ